ncbi:SDR family oxidoreductase [Amycolatopsis taiwanensis]|uniref:Short-chain dehydrogenase n=1 Tax=Amycolatopsis taiwanensis TaxID=342230 RepID=A0A9W6QYT3_9PSEU|nr:SDR family oxidoreductase [Amycolatopsis taiwanensis]GLY66044.1 short-chain dehydrogenase [Amycolatopsis taiwanensis]
MEIKHQIALVTGANRGLGKRFVTELLERGAARVYAAARKPESVDVPGAVPLRLDVTDDASVEAAAAVAGDVTLLINNAGVATLSSFIGSDLANARQEMEVNFWGSLRMVRAFAPILDLNGGGAILNVLSQSSFRAFGFADTYGAAKAAAWQLTNGVRLELAGQRTQVTGLAMALVDTDMSAWAKSEPGWSLADPADVVRAALDGVEAGALEVYGDEMTREWRARLGEPTESLYPQAIGVPTGQR